MPVFESLIMTMLHVWFAGCCRGKSGDKFEQAREKRQVNKNNAGESECRGDRSRAMLRSKPLRLAMAAAVVYLAQGTTGALAAAATGVMTVTATVASTCTVGASTLAFGSVTSAAIQAGNIDATGTVTVNCTTGSAYTVALDKGAGTGSTIPSRKMTAAAVVLSYTIYTEATRATVWGDGTASSTVAGTGSGAVQTLTAYGRIFSGQTVPAATYTDTVNVTVTY